MDRLLDAQYAGPPFLRMPAMARVMVAAIQRGAISDYLWHAWVVMPNHVHLLITRYIEPSILLRQLKGVSSREADALLGRTGRKLWQDESYDHLVRSAKEFQRVEDYITQNPVRAGLRTRPKNPWSSASIVGGLNPAAG
jgi:type I restriction enzyme R subunit/putative DNA methylase